MKLAENRTKCGQTTEENILTDERIAARSELLSCAIAAATSAGVDTLAPRTWAAAAAAAACAAGVSGRGVSGGGGGAGVSGGGAEGGGGGGRRDSDVS